MVCCPQCGANLPLPEREAHARCRFCGTAFIPAQTETDHSFVPWALSPLALRQAIKDHWIRSGIAPSAAEIEAVDVRKYFLPFRRGATGEVRPAFSSHRAELLAFVPPGADLRRFTAEAVGSETIVIEPSADATAGESLLHYPFARAAASTSGEARVLWIDAARGRVLATGEGKSGAGVAPRATAVLASAFLLYFAIAIAIPLPWSLGAVALATPFLLRWSERRVVGQD